MTHALSRLVAAASKVTMTQQEREEQRISFAYGSAKIENERVTEQMVRDAAKKVHSNSGSNG